VCKPRFGAGSLETYRVADATALAALLARRDLLRPDELGEPLLQPYLPGIAASIAFLCGPGGALPLLPCSQHIDYRDGFQYLGGEVPLPEPLAARAVALARRAVAVVPGLSGYVGVDLLLGDATDVVLEINPRLTTSYLGLRALCRDNLAAAVLRLARGESIAPPGWKSGRVRFGVDGRVEAG
jgi:predicted ATP-grasp superfamily ATP-dependent carboligase